eukprot:Hpha_TRINITY_DN4886_c0_g1::TRINITY_DN4886_c0_g1_i1::g.20222::m.20222
MVMRPMLAGLPFLGGMEIMFINPPEIDLDFRGIANVADVPGLNERVRKVMRDGVSGVLALPYRIGLPFAFRHPDVDPSSHTYPLPEGILRLRCVKALGLRSADLGGKSDPYVQINVGVQCQRTPVKNNTLNPIWEKDASTMDFVVFSQEQWVQFSLYDHDAASSDDVLGHVRFATVRELRALTQGGSADLEIEGGSGTLEICAQWRVFEKEAPDTCETGPSTSLMRVFLRELKGLPVAAKLAPFKIKAVVDVPERLRPSGWKMQAQPFSTTQTSIAGWARWDSYADDAAERLSAAIANEAHRVSPVCVWREAQTDEAVASRLNVSIDIIKDWHAARSDPSAFKAWSERAVACMESRKVDQAPQFEQSLHILLPSRWERITLSLLSGPKEKCMGSCRLWPSALNGDGGTAHVSSLDPAGEELSRTVLHPPEPGCPLEGPFTLGVEGLCQGDGSEAVVQLHGSVQLYHHVSEADALFARSATALRRKRTITLDPSKVCNKCAVALTVTRRGTACSVCSSLVCGRCLRTEQMKKSQQAVKVCHDCYVGKCHGLGERRVVVDIIQGRDLMKADLFGLSDPYAIITYGSEVRKTAVQKKTLNPTWNERFVFSFLPQQGMKIAVFDEDLIGAHDPLGCVNFSPHEALASEWLPLRPEAEAAKLKTMRLGEIQVAVRVLERGENYTTLGGSAAGATAESVCGSPRGRGFPTVVLFTVSDLTGLEGDPKDVEITYAGRSLTGVPSGRVVDFAAHFVPGALAHAEIDKSGTGPDRAAIDPIKARHGAGEWYTLLGSAFSGSQRRQTFGETTMGNQVEVSIRFIPTAVQGVLKSGVLWKLGRTGRWNKRYWNCHRGALEYGSSPNGSRKKLDISGAGVHRKVNADRPHSLALSAGKLSRTYVLSAEDDQERDLWIVCLRSAADSGTQSLSPELQETLVAPWSPSAALSPGAMSHTTQGSTPVKRTR